MVRLSASVERCFVSRMRDFFSDILEHILLKLKKKNPILCYIALFFSFALFNIPTTYTQCNSQNEHFLCGLIQVLYFCLGTKPLPGGISSQLYTTFRALYGEKVIITTVLMFFSKRILGD